MSVVIVILVTYKAVWVPTYSIAASVAVSHLDYLGVQVTWISGPWFLSIFVNTLPWESGEVYAVFFGSYKVTESTLNLLYPKACNLTVGHSVFSSSSLGRAAI